MVVTVPVLHRLTANGIRSQQRKERKGKERRGEERVPSTTDDDRRSAIDAQSERLMENEPTPVTPCTDTQGAIVAVENPAKNFYGFQFHPEVAHTGTGLCVEAGCTREPRQGCRASGAQEMSSLPHYFPVQVCCLGHADNGACLAVHHTTSLCKSAARGMQIASTPCCPPYYLQ
eukprot:scaffold2041_cov20-Tisochrysis_lutea.AAC.5